MSVARLKSKIWVQARIRLCDLNAIPAAVVHRGDPDAGAVLLKVNRLAKGCEVLSQFREPDGALAWMRSISPNPVPEADADAYIQRQLKSDPDLWVIEIEDVDAKLTLDEPVR